jgi:hypothetical protein
MTPGIGLNVRITPHCSQDGNYLEEVDNEEHLQYAFFGFFDGHWGQDTETFIKQHPMDYTENQKGIWYDK